MRGWLAFGSLGMFRLLSSQGRLFGCSLMSARGPASFAVSVQILSESYYLLYLSHLERLVFIALEVRIKTREVDSRSSEPTDVAGQLPFRGVGEGYLQQPFAKIDSSV